ncbi:MAG: hypothetical protein E4H01_07350 [Lysobacterales bacterium]|nr:MAG: hypothetical protein E4H01_07350 [Xanthomonadales bacterium]
MVTDQELHKALGDLQRMSDITDSFRNATSVIKALRVWQEEQRARAKEQAALESQITATKAQISGMKAQCANVSAEIDAARSKSVEDRAAINAETAQVAAKRNQALAELDDVKAQIAASKQEHADMIKAAEVKLQKINAEIDRMRKQFAA